MTPIQQEIRLFLRGPGTTTHYRRNGEQFGDFCGEGQSLLSLSSSPLQHHFFSWRGLSGLRYVFSVFCAKEEATVATFSNCLVLGISRSGAQRAPLVARFSNDGPVLKGLNATAMGIDEWHVLFEADDETINDLAKGIFRDNSDHEIHVDHLPIAGHC